MSKEIYLPFKPELADQKTCTRSLNAYITKAGGWLTSIPGNPEMRFEALPDSGLPAALRDLGYVVEKTGQSQRILPHASMERFETSSSGALVTATENSTKPVTTRSHPCRPGGRRSI